MENSLRNESTCVNRNIQLMYDAIRRARPWDTRPVQNMYTTAQEKYLIELIKKGHSIPYEIIVHVVNQCTETHTYSDGSFSCCYGYILIGVESEHLKCKRGLHILNDSLFCHNGFIYYPVDLLHNAFGDWRPDETHTRHDIQEVYELIRQKWPYFCNGDDAYKYTLKHLVCMIENGAIVSKGVKKHVINGCKLNKHCLDNIHTCFFGYLSFHDSKMNERYRVDMKEYLAIRNTPRRKKSIRHIVKLSNQDTLKKIYQRVCHRDCIALDSSWKEIHICLSEKNDLLHLGMLKDVPNNVVSHVVEGCIYKHRLTDNFVCRAGYICTYDEYRAWKMCMLEEPTDSYNDPTIYDIGNVLIGHEQANIRPNIAPPPPPDFLDNDHGQQRDIAIIRPNYRRNLDHIENEELEENLEQHIVGNQAPNMNRHPNLAPPPEEVDI